MIIWEIPSTPVLHSKLLGLQKENSSYWSSSFFSIVLRFCSLDKKSRYGIRVNPPLGFCSLV